MNILAKRKPSGKIIPIYGVFSKNEVSWPTEILKTSAQSRVEFETCQPRLILEKERGFVVLSQNCGTLKNLAVWGRFIRPER
jgi:hypothetical protein